MATQQEIIAQLRDSHGRKVSKAFLDAVANARDRIDWDEIARLIQRGRSAEAYQVIADAINYQPIRTPLEDAVIAAGRAMQGVPDLTRMEVHFDVSNPRITQFMRAYDLDLIRNLNDSARQTIREVLQTGLDAGRNPLDIARDVRESIGLTPRQEAAVRNYRAGLEDASRAPKQRALRDKRFDPSVTRAADKGEPLPKAKIDKMVERYRAKYLKYRSEVIARTETARAISFGQQAMWQQLVDNGQLRAEQVEKRWIYTHDGKTRDAHIGIPTLNKERVVTLDRPFDSALGPIYFPGDPNAVAANSVNCRCAVVYRIRTDI